MGFTDEDYEFLTRAAEALKNGEVKQDMDSAGVFFIFEGKRIEIEISPNDMQVAE